MGSIVSGVMILEALRDDLADLLPMVRRATRLDPGALIRIRGSGHRLTVLVRLPFAVLAGRTIASATDSAGLDVTVLGAEFVHWLDTDGADVPAARDPQWRGTVPPTARWQRIDTVPDAVVRDLVRSGARTLSAAATREGVPDAQPRAQVADALLDSVVLTVSDELGRSVPVTLRLLSALTRLGFLPIDSYISVDVVGRWTRVAAEFGSVYAERAGSGLTVI